MAIHITGATGALNGVTVDHLLRLMPAEDIVVIARDVVRAQRFADLGIEVREGDYARPETLPAAFEGADQLLLVSSGDPAVDAVELHRTAIAAAADVGVGRVLYTSHQGASLDNPFRPGRTHAETEQLLAGSGLPWTSLRNGFYAHSLPMFLGPWRTTGVITVPGDGPVSWTSREEAGEAAAHVLASQGAYDGPVTLTAQAAPTFADVAAIASDLAGHTIELVVVAEEEWVAARVAAGVNEYLARFQLGFYQGAAQGSFADVDPLLAELLGRDPATARDALAVP